MAGDASGGNEGKGRKVPMKLLVLGLSRTGTSSTQKALLDLGYSNVYHTRTILFDRPKDGVVWAELFARKFEKKQPILKQEWDDLLGDFDAVTDVPCAIFWRELIEAYPDAKVVLTVRDSTEAWYRSYAETIGVLTAAYNTAAASAVRAWPLSWLLSNEEETAVDRMLGCQIRYTPRGRYAEEGRRWYEEHNAAVRAAVPVGRLLVFNVKEGWAPLCEFLGKPVPAEPFPHVFEREEYLKTISRMAEVRRARLVKRVLVALAVIVAVALGSRYLVGPLRNLVARASLRLGRVRARLPSKSCHTN